MKSMQALVALMVSAALAGCGGGGSSGAGTNVFASIPTDALGEAIIPATDLVLEVASPTVANTGTASVAITATALSAARNALADANIRLSVDGEAIVSANESKTDANGQLHATVTIGANHANRLLTITAASGSGSSLVTRTATVQVVGAKLSATLVPSVIAPNAAGKVQYRLVDQAGTPMANQDVKIVAPGLNPAQATGKTGINGDYEFSFVAPAAAGNYAISASAGGTTLDPASVLQVQGASSIPSVTNPITSASVSATPTVIGVNTLGSSSNRAEIRALFLTSSNQRVPNVRVKFDLGGDVKSIGGSLATGTATLYSDANGNVATAYIPGTRSSPTDGVTVRACYYLDDASAAADPYDANGTIVGCARSAAATLTVTSEPLGVSIGTGDQIQINELTYAKKFVVSVVDAAGVAKPDVAIAVSLDLPQYRKGFYSRPVDKWEKTEVAVCANEDRNRNGVLEVGEDVNGNGRLEPGKSDVSISLLHAKTRADGTAELQILYPKNFGSWVDALITVSASGVLGTEGRATYLVSPVQVDAASIGAEPPPAYVRSPYGVTTSCTSPN